MSTSVAGLTSNFFPSAQSGFTTTLASTISSGATTVPLNSVAAYSNGEVAVLVVDPSDATKKQTFTGVVDTSGIQITSVVWTAGTNQVHTGGSTVVDYATATHISMMTKGVLTHADQDGTLKAGAVDVAAVLASNVVTTAKIADAAVTLTKLGFTVSTQANAGDAGGTMYYANLGGIKLCWGQTANQAAIPAGNAFNVTLPTAFFATIQSAVVVALPGGDSRSTNSVQSCSTTTLAIFYINAAGSFSSTPYYFVIGT